NHFDDDGEQEASKDERQVTGIVVGGTASNPVFYVSSSDPEVGGPSGDKNLDTNSGVITRFSWKGSSRNDPNGFWEVVDIVRGLPRSEENHASNGMELVSINGKNYLLLCSGGHANAGAPSSKFAYLTDFALSAAVLIIDLDMIESMPIWTDTRTGRKVVFDPLTVDDPQKENITNSDPRFPYPAGHPYYNETIDVNDPFGGNDGLNQAKLLVSTNDKPMPVQIFSPGYRNTYDLVVTQSGAVYVTDNGANGTWGGYPFGEATANVDNRFRPGEPGSSDFDSDNNEAKVNNSDHLNLVTTNINNYTFGSVYGGHPVPVRANLNAGLYTRGDNDNPNTEDPNDTDNDGFTDGFFRTKKYDPNSADPDASNPKRALPADWPPIDPSLINVIEGDFRQPVINNNTGVRSGNNDYGGGADAQDIIVANWGNNTNGIDEYTSSLYFGGSMQGALIAGENSGKLHLLYMKNDGTLQSIEQEKYTVGGNPLGITCNGDSDPFPGTIWVATFNGNIQILEPDEILACIEPNEPGYDGSADYDADGYSNDEELDPANDTDHCNAG
ncbi:MAG: hypothetical protein AAFU64_10665, partial [Bacteroidota bacterium]